MNAARERHMAINYYDKYLVVMGGYERDDIEHFDGQTWVTVPTKLPYKLAGARAVLDRGGRIIITGGFNSGGTLDTMIVYDPEKKGVTPGENILKVVDNCKLKEKRYRHVAILQ